MQTSAVPQAEGIAMPLHPREAGGKVKWMLGVITFGKSLSPTCHYLGHGPLSWQVLSPHLVGVFHFLSLSGRRTSNVLRRQGGCADIKKRPQGFEGEGRVVKDS